MSNVAASRLGKINGSGPDDALFLKVFSGEILTQFEELNVMKELHTVRTISSGKTAQFPVTGIASAKYHHAGEDLLTASNGYLSTIKKGERTISIDDVLIASTFIANIDELKNHYDVRSIYAKELAKALAKRFDLATMKTLIAAGLTTSTPHDDAPTGTALAPNYANPAAPTAAELITSMFEVAQSLDEKDAPSEGRFALLRPEDYYTLLTTDNVAVSKDFGDGGNVASGTIARVAGIRLVKTNHIADCTVAASALDQDDDSGSGDTIGVRNEPFGDTGAANADGYNADLNAVRFVAGTPEAIGTVKLLDLATESEYQIQRQGNLFVAKYAMGHGVLRPECAVTVSPT